MKEAIKLAIENGWNAKPNSVVVMSGAFALEASFWQALGKALGMSETQWFYTATSYFTCVMRNGDTEKFWKDLLTTNK